MMDQGCIPAAKHHAGSLREGPPPPPPSGSSGPPLPPAFLCSNHFQQRPYILQTIYTLQSYHRARMIRGGIPKRITALAAHPSRKNRSRRQFKEREQDAAAAAAPHADSSSEEDSVSEDDPKKLNQLIPDPDHPSNCKICRKFRKSVRGAIRLHHQQILPLEELASAHFLKQGGLYDTPHGRSLMQIVKKGHGSLTFDQLLNALVKADSRFELAKLTMDGEKVPALRLLGAQPNRWAMSWEVTEELRVALIKALNAVLHSSKGTMPRKQFCRKLRKAFEKKRAWGLVASPFGGVWELLKRAGLLNHPQLHTKVGN